MWAVAKMKDGDATKPVGPRSMRLGSRPQRPAKAAARAASRCTASTQLSGRGRHDEQGDIIGNKKKKDWKRR